MQLSPALTCERDVFAQAYDGDDRAIPVVSRNRILALCLPDVSLVVSIVTLFYCLFLFDGWQKLFRDSDTGWHIRTGESIALMRELPKSDPYSFTRAHQPWIDWEWGADLLSGIAHRAAGLAGVAATFAVAIAACSWLWFRLNFAVNGSLLLACALAPMMLSTANIHWLARPHVFGWLFLLVFLRFIERLRDRSFTLGWAVGFFALGACWSNFHASFVLAPVAGLLYAFAAWLKPRIWNGEDRRAALPFAAAAASFAAGTLLNPYGWTLHAHVASYLANSELLDRIGEFQTFNFHTAGSAQILIAVAVCGIGAVVALTQRRLEHFLLITLLMVFGLRSARGLPILALAALPLANGAISAALRKSRGLAPKLRGQLTGFFNYDDRLRVIDRGLSGVVMVPVVLLVLLAIVRSPALAAHAGFPPDQFPVLASASVSQLPRTARILAPDKFGGYLIYRFNGSRKVYFDGRSDFYGAPFMKDYIGLVEVRPGWREQVARLGFTHALLPVNYSLVPALEQSGWRTVYKDATATLLAAPEHN